MAPARVPATARHRPRDPASRAVACALFCAALLPAGARAQTAAYTSNDTLARSMQGGGLQMQAVGTQSGYYDTNPLLLNSGAKALWGSITAPEMIVNDATPTATVMSDTVFDSNNFNQSAFDSNDVHSKLNLQDKTERWNTGFQGNVDYDTTRTSELSNYNLHAAPVRHFGGTAAPSIAYNANPTDSWGLTGAYTSSQYDSIFTGYRAVSVTPSYTHQFDQMNSGVVSLQAQRYTATSGPSSTVDTIGPSFGWIGTLTPNLSANAAAGAQTTRQKGAGIVSPSWTAQYTFNAGLTYKGEQDKTDLSASRLQYPFGNGTEALLTTLSLSDTHIINDLFSVGGGGSYQTTNYQTTSAGSIDTLLTGTANFTWHATEHVDVVSAYEYRRETLVGFSQGIDDHMVTISLAWHPKAWTL